MLLAIVGLLAFGCGSKEAGKDDGGKLRVVSTVGMIADAVKEVGGEEVESIGLMGPGIDPHLYRATAGDVEKLESADVIFYGGLELEGRMTDIFVKMAGRGTPTHAVSERVPGAELREPPEFHGKFDPHIWFDVLLWKHAVESIRDGLAKARPASTAKIGERADAYLKKLDDLHRYVQEQVARVPKEQRILITAHDAFGYFGKRYGFEVIGIQGTSTATEAGAGDLRRIADLITQKRVKAIFVESSVPPATIEALQKAVQSRGWNVAIGGELFSDAMGQAGTPEGTYIGMVRHNVDTIVGALL
ncbi:MAG TPA: zinc ABC transporter substrate-binding protein [Fimbriimonadaceae bacterium]|nr:zinc ABC transporter substrate-binding protein [Fimbriimonadaceae bacterium]HRJ95639.1 zinc ABC transporter substrate-binding protein [Fimbriimonadaceae bacterium]